MKKFNAVLSTLISFLSIGCTEHRNQNELHFATAAEYPPFEYMINGEIKGFDIDLAKLVAKEMGKTAVFDNMQPLQLRPIVRKILTSQHLITSKGWRSSIKSMLR